jgi:hypothetical protein
MIGMAFQARNASGRCGIGSSFRKRMSRGGELVAPRPEVSEASNFNNLRSQTSIKIRTDTRGLFGEVSNLPRRQIRRSLSAR